MTQNWKLINFRIDFDAEVERRVIRAPTLVYEQRVQKVEHFSFSPLIMSATGGMVREATNFCKDKHCSSPRNEIRRVVKP